MENSVNFTNEWQVLQARRQTLMNEVNQLKHRLNNLADEPEIAQMLKEKDRLKKEVRNLQYDIKSYEANIENRTIMIKNCQLVLDGKQTKKEFDRARDNFIRDVKRVKRNKKLSVSRITIQFLGEVEKSIVVPLHEILQYLGQQNNNDKQKKQTIQEAQIHIQHIKENYRQVKKCLEREIQDIEEKRRFHYGEILRWITQDRKHLEWVLENEPLYKDDAMSHYKERFPNNDLSDLIPKTASESMCRFAPAKTRQRKTEHAQPLALEPSVVKNQEWEFFIASNKNDPGIKLPSRREEFLTEIQPYLPKNVQSLKVGLVYKKLVATTKMDIHQRQLNIKKIIESEFHGWQSWPIGGYRILIFIDENLYKIKFILQKRNESYLKNH